LGRSATAKEKKIIFYNAVVPVSSELARAVLYSINTERLVK